MKNESTLVIVLLSCFLLSCSKAPRIDKAYYTFTNNSGHTFEVLIGGPESYYHHYAEIPDGKSVTFAFDDEAPNCSKVYLWTHRYYFFTWLKLRVDNQFVKYWRDVWPHHDGDVSDSFFSVNNPVDLAASGVIKNGIIKDTVFLTINNYLLAKLHYYVANYLNNNEDGPIVEIDGSYQYDEALLRQFIESHPTFKEYLDITSAEFDKDRDEALAYMTTYKKQMSQ